MSKTNIFNLVGTIETLEERDLPSGDGQYKLLQICPSFCERKLTLFVSPSYRNGEENKVYKELDNFKEGNCVRLTLSPFNNKLFLFGIKSFNPKGDI